MWQRHWRDFREIYPERFAPIYGRLSDDKISEVMKLLSCGDYRNGFRKHACPDCGTALVVPFTCKSRLCLSCYRKKLYGWSINLSHIMNPSLSHFHITFTLPGAVTRAMFEKGFPCEDMITLAAGVYWKELRKSSGNRGKEWQSGNIATVHVCGNALNYNPHVHLIGTRELVNTKTGELCDTSFINYRRMRFAWMNAMLKLLRKKGVINSDDILSVKEKYKNGFHVHFKPIADEVTNDVLFRTAEYLASGYFHNSMITHVDHDIMKVTFRYKSWVDRNTKEKSYSEMTMDIYEFMARLLYFLPEKNRKMIRYYGIYSHNLGEKLVIANRKTWAKAIENSFDKNPELCPDCGKEMRSSVVFSFYADRVWQKLVRNHDLSQGYFRPRRGS